MPQKETPTEILTVDSGVDFVELSLRSNGVFVDMETSETTV